MDGITTAQDLEAMTPAERHADFESRVVTDPAHLPPAYRERAARTAARVVAQARKAS
jgi:hypothetical protein